MDVRIVGRFPKGVTHASIKQTVGKACSTSRKKANTSIRIVTNVDHATHLLAGTGWDNTKEGQKAKDTLHIPILDGHGWITHVTNGGEPSAHNHPSLFLANAPTAAANKASSSNTPKTKTNASQKPKDKTKRAAPAPAPAAVGKKRTRRAAAKAAPAAAAAATPSPAPKRTKRQAATAASTSKKGKGKAAAAASPSATPAATTATAKKSSRKKSTAGKSSAKSGTTPKSAAAAGKSAHHKTVVVKGDAPVDDLCPVADHAHVVTDASGVRDARLNQTNIANNNNKYYTIQLLKHDSSDQYYVWTRWGRVNKIAGSNLSQHGANKRSAEVAFEKKFHDKTKNHWSNRDNFVAKAGKYTLLQLDYGQDDDDKRLDADGDVNMTDTKIPDSKLEQPVQDLIKLICNMRMMTEQMKEIGYDAEKLPLGKLSKATIKQGFSALKDISAALDSGASHHVFVNLSNQFYTYIPHDFGMRRPTVINSHAMVKQKLQMVESLADIEVATKLLKSMKDKADSVNPVDAQYSALGCDLEPIAKKGQEMALIKRYVKNTHGKTHNRYTLDVEEVYRCHRPDEEARFEPFADSANRQLLWHGSRLTNFCGILSQGLRIAPPEAPVTGYMFGKGVYFADMVSKSANYCAVTRANNTGILMLCEVALGNMNERLQSCYTANELPKNKHSTKGVGSMHPDPKKLVKLPDGCIVPCGKAMEKKNHNGSLLYNEFIVYDVARIRVRYLVKMKFNFKY